MSDAIRTAEIEYAMPELDELDVAARGAAWLDLLAARAGQTTALQRPTPTGKTRDGADVRAYVSQGRWVVECSCGSALVVSPEDPRFFCAECRNRAVGHDYVRVIFPSSRARGAIERVLLDRPNELHRTWLPHEDLETLAAENEHPLVATGTPTLAQDRELELLESMRGNPTA